MGGMKTDDRGTPEERFEKYSVAKGTDECWPWIGGTNEHGYGRLKVGKKKILAHRLAFEWASGEILLDCDKILHTCDNPPCVNPYHLVRGTQKQNVLDMYTKGRQNRPRGESVKIGKLTEEDVRNIRKLRRSQMKVKDIAILFSVSSHAVSALTTGKTWKHIPEEDSVFV